MKIVASHQDQVFQIMKKIAYQLKPRFHLLESANEQNSELITPVENAMSQGEIGSNLETDMPVDTIVTMPVNRIIQLIIS